MRLQNDLEFTLYKPGCKSFWHVTAHSTSTLILFLFRAFPMKR